ncbi:phosphomannomutase [Parabacteroides sp. PF5-5]|uniref:phosphoglucosamine mutase n=1 Tax=unclassified Parabacteroides TaxID=2649774 RepID=UPI002473E2B3|nr:MULTISPECIES: phosphoglucosamine mutase [unclassified Parabacteroides]MDH6304706.1 phosphomannomutase [Parabacteroides sp. PH5-39]MDH6315679.1 phosphomannomutase [Parabacteroides sp. PF5-13]MDH6319340.1 phosphomannomutase [Parabacteroides sp. PH5-13]MDH6323071.1 phosphomannomutase [Parabacteroides sp. PH5-8]MDH6326872.1 phosphomannomutase [Parabacteroides sp. PH5-41]
MTLIKSISGIRGTIGGNPDEGLNPLAIVKFVAAYATFIRKNAKATSNKIVVGRDARISGSMVKQVVLGTLTGMGFDVVDLDMATTPTTEIAVVMEKACGGIILTASHNPKQWNALKLLNERGEFLNAAEGQEVLDLAASEQFVFADVDHLGKVTTDATYKQKHIESVLNLALVDVEAIKAANFRVAIDAVNSVGGVVLPDLLYALGVKEIFKLHCAPHGNFSHNPEPLPEHLTEISQLMTQAKADVGFVVDPDVDRLAIVCENGEMFGEEYTLVAVADYVLSHTPGNTVSNLSSSRALRDVTRMHGGEYTAAAVGEVNVVTKMKETHAVIGGEGNGGIIYPSSHYGRDALVGIALFLSHLAKKKMKTSELRASYPPYFISKQKVELTPEINVDAILEKVKEKFAQYDITDIDGVKIDFPDKWVHLRKSNTEPIIRIYSEAPTMKEAEELGGQLISIIHEMCR